MNGMSSVRRPLMILCILSLTLLNSCSANRQDKLLSGKEPGSSEKSGSGCPHGSPPVYDWDSGDWFAEEDIIDAWPAEWFGEVDVWDARPADVPPDLEVTDLLSEQLQMDAEIDAEDSEVPASDAVLPQDLIVDGDLGCSLCNDLGHDVGELTAPGAD